MLVPPVGASLHCFCQDDACDQCGDSDNNSGGGCDKCLLFHILVFIFVYELTEFIELASALNLHEIIDVAIIHSLNSINS